MRQLVRFLASSMRARSEIERRLYDGTPIYVYLRPWDELIVAGVEFRCFVLPLMEFAMNDGQQQLSISAMSQYYWHHPFPRVHKDDAADIGCLALEGGEKLLEEVTEAAKEANTVDGLKTSGFAMDVVVKIDGSKREVQLVETNPFGAMSGCGSCLFHWIQDARQLYGLKESVQIRVAADSS